eukprot:364487-Chlamydomonas_euryale.AAC.23
MAWQRARALGCCRAGRNAVLCADAESNVGAHTEPTRPRRLLTGRLDALTRSGRMPCEYRATCSMCVA